MPIYKRISEYISNEGLKQKVVAEKSGFDEKKFSAMMNGRRKIYAEDLQAICKALKVDPNDFLA